MLYQNIEDLKFDMPFIRIIPEDSKNTGIYFLFKNNEVVYIGKSRNVLSRLGQHSKVKDFDDAYYLTLDNDITEETLNSIEGALIRKYEPILNGTTLSLYAPGDGEKDFFYLSEYIEKHI